MAKTRELKRRIHSVEKTRQITKTMEMIATSRLKRTQDRVVAARPYAAALAEVIGTLYDPRLEEQFPLLRYPVGDPKRVALVLITSNRGLCGSFNANLIRMARDRIAELEARGVEVELLGVGRKGIGYFKYMGRSFAEERLDIGDRPTPEHAAELVEPLMRRFAEGELDAVEVVFARFDSPVSTPPMLLRLLPIARPEGGQTVNYLLRPSPQEIVRAILPLYVRNGMYRALVESAASENGARRSAMKNATDSAGDMIDVLRRNYNRARQGQITQELAEIVGGAEALKG